MTEPPPDTTAPPASPDDDAPSPAPPGEEAPDLDDAPGGDGDGDGIETTIGEPNSFEPEEDPEVGETSEG